METIIELLTGLKTFWLGTGFVGLTIPNAIMMVVGLLFISLAIIKHYEPLLLLPIGFGVVVGNIPNASGVYDDGSVMAMLYYGVKYGLYPPIIFLGIGAMTDFSTML